VAVRQLRDETGHATVTYLLAIAISLMVFVSMVNVLLFVYARGVIRAAVDEGARSGSFSNAGEVECEARAGDALADLLGGRLGDGVSVSCADTGTEIIATADATLTSPIPGFGDWTFSLEATVVREPDFGATP
jgi:hypothetical protein